MPRLTETMLRKLHNKVQPKATIIRDSDLKGFAARVSPKGSISFICEARIKGLGGSAKRISIGKYPAYSVEQARNTAKEHLQLMYQGVDPQKVQKSKIDTTKEANEYTLQSVLDEYLERKELKEKTITDYRLTVNFVYKDFLDKPIVDISRKDVEDTFFRLESRSTANKSSRILSALCNYCKGIELSNGQRLLRENPVAILQDKRIKRTLPRKQSVISPEELIQILSRLRNELQAQGDSVDMKKILKNQLRRKHKTHRKDTRFNHGILRAIYILGLTGARKNEICKLKTSDIKKEYISITGTKNKIDYAIPITKQIRWVIEDAIDSAKVKKSPYLFSRDFDSSRPIDGTSKAVKYYLKKYTLHDFRRTFITTASELGISTDAIKRLVNHKSSSDVTEGYIIQRVEKRLPLLKSYYKMIQAEMLNTDYLPSQEQVFSVPL